MRTGCAIAGFPGVKITGGLKMGFSDKIAAMGRGYLDRTEARLASLVHQINGSSLDWGEARRTFHDIAGTAPVFGFAALGEYARGAEDLAAAQADVDAIRAHVEELLRRIGQARPS
jgi:HPt (histidine-containing phosphotransfer) domain-containing protein